MSPRVSKVILQTPEVGGAADAFQHVLPVLPLTIALNVLRDTVYQTVFVKTKQHAVLSLTVNYATAKVVSSVSSLTFSISTEQLASLLALVHVQLVITPMSLLVNSVTLAALPVQILLIVAHSVRMDFIFTEKDVLPSAQSVSLLIIRSRHANHVLLIV